MRCLALIFAVVVLAAADAAVARRSNELNDVADINSRITGESPDSKYGFVIRAIKFRF